MEIFGSFVVQMYPRTAAAKNRSNRPGDQGRGIRALPAQQFHTGGEEEILCRCGSGQRGGKVLFVVVGKDGGHRPVALLRKVDPDNQGGGLW